MAPPDPPDIELPPIVALADPGPFLAAVTDTPWFHQNLGRLKTVEMWALVALCALARRGLPDEVRADVYARGEPGAAGRFAHAVGFEEARDGIAPPAKIQQARTVPIQRVAQGASAVQAASTIARLAVPDEEESESRDALAYVIDELLRNVLQHSGDPLGAVVGAQFIAPGKAGYGRPTVQIAVADTGRGILDSLRRFHDVPNAEVALEKALRPHISGTFPEGQTGSLDNAGLGLFFTAEMAKLTESRFLLATRGSALLLETLEDSGNPRLQILKPPATGFPGTLAVFELPLEIVDRDALLATIRRRASERTPTQTTRSWLAYEPPPSEVRVLPVRSGAESAAAAKELGELVRSSVSTGVPIALDFAGIEIATQSFLHALLFHGVRVGWAMGTPIFVVRASSAVRSGLDYLESYAFR